MSRRRYRPLWAMPAPASGEMISLRYDELARATTPALVRFAAWLGVAPEGPWLTELGQRRAHIQAIMAAEERLAGMSPAARSNPAATRRNG